MQDPLSRVTGVGNVQVFGAQYAMRIWLDPYKLHNYSLTAVGRVATPSRRRTSRSRPAQIGAQPAVPGQELNATVTAQSRLQTPEQFRNIILKTIAGGAVVRLRDVARVELGADNYAIVSLFNGMPAAGHRHHAGAGRQRADDRGRGQGQGRGAASAACRRA